MGEVIQPIDATSIAHVLRLYELSSRRPYNFRHSDEIIVWNPSGDPSLSRYLEFLGGQLLESDPRGSTGSEGNVRGWLLQLVAQEVLDSMVDEPYTVLHAPVEFDATLQSPRMDKGADLFLAKKHDDGSFEIVCLFDVTRDKPNSEIKDGVNYRLGYPLPVVLVQFGNVQWQVKSRRQETRSFLQSAIRQAIMTGEMDDDILASFTSETTQQAVREKILHGIRLTEGRIRSKMRGDDAKDRLLSQLAQTERIFGISPDSQEEEGIEREAV